MTKEIHLELSGGIFDLAITDDGGGGSVTSNLHYDSLEDFLEDEDEADGEPLEQQFNYGRYEGAIDGVESFLIALACAGVDVESEPVKQALQTALDAIGNNL